ncbi:hypothetical protein OF83DRAFT_1089325, partial [Amylostereum chailletii]
MAHRAKVLRVSGGDGLSQTSDAELENKAPPNFVYLQSHLPQHASATRAHLAGQIATAEGHLEHSFHPPSGYWTPSEKQLFFHGLAVYSRLRPDLIAAHVGTKTAVDVAIYIRLLQDGLKTTAGSLLTSRANMPQAHEASEDLVELEEEQAALLCGAEPHYEDETRALDREEAAIAFQSLYPQLDETAPEGVNTHVSGETIQLLHTLVEDFVRRLMHRTIEAREIEYDLKAHTKAWRLGKERQ